MTEQNKIAGLVLAGGLGRRMAYQDKGLILLQGQPLISYAISALKALTDTVAISANRHQALYAKWSTPVIADDLPDFSGPLAGILSAMRQLDADVLLVLPCDSPRFGSVQLQALLEALKEPVDIAIASDGDRLHPVFMALRSRLQPSLEAYLHSGQRKLQDWIGQQAWVAVDFHNQAEVFLNLNTPADWAALQISSRG